VSAIAKARNIGSEVVELFEYRGQLYPDYLKRGNAMQFIEPIAKQFCRGIGLDVGCGKWPLKGARPIDLADGKDACALPEGIWDYVFSSHCLEHLANPVAAIEHWKTRLRAGGTLFLYLPHPDMAYWRPENCRKHVHLFRPADIAEMLRALGFERVIHSERDLMWSFAVVGFKGSE
jgi:SAM-dependent methyltransferase